MPFPITQGYGSQGDASGSGLASVWGYGDPGIPVGACNTFALLLGEVYQDRIELVFSTNVQAVGPAADPTQWTITTATPGVVIPVVTSVVVAGPRIKLFYSEAKTGINYVLHFPVVGVQDLSTNPYPGPFTYNFTGLGINPFVTLAGAEDGYHVRVIFSEKVVVSEALNAANYAITGGGGLTVFDVVQETDLVYRLHTSLQIVGQDYVLTVSNIHDLQGNPI